MLNTIAWDLTEKNGHGHVRLVSHTLLKHCRDHIVLLDLWAEVPRPSGFLPHVQDAYRPCMLVHLFIIHQALSHLNSTSPVRQEQDTHNSSLFFKQRTEVCSKQSPYLLRSGEMTFKIDQSLVHSDQPLIIWYLYFYCQEINVNSSDTIGAPTEMGVET